MPSNWLGYKLKWRRHSPGFYYYVFKPGVYGEILKESQSRWFWRIFPHSGIKFSDRRFASLGHAAADCEQWAKKIEIMEE